MRHAFREILPGDSRAFYLCLAEPAILLVLDSQKAADFRKKRKRCGLLVGPGQIYFDRNASSVHGFDSSTEDNHNGNRARYRGQPQQKQSSLRRTTESTTMGTGLAIEDYHNENRARHGGLPQREQSSLRRTTTTETELATEDYHNGNRARYGGLPQRHQRSLRRTTTTGTELATEVNRVNHNGNRARYGGLPQQKQDSLRRTTTTGTELATEDYHRARERHISIAAREISNLL